MPVFMWGSTSAYLLLSVSGTGCGALPAASDIDGSISYTYCMSRHNFFGGKQLRV
jgi:hypothetical protein